MNPLLDLLGTAGTILDTPGSVVRGLLAADPRRALEGVVRPEERVMGRDLLEQYGLVDAPDESFGLDDLAGMGVDMAVDPLSIYGAVKGAKGIASQLPAMWADDAGHVGLPIPKEQPLAPTFYSRLEKAAQGLPDKPIQTNALMNLLRKAPEGLSTEELQLRKLNDFIGNQGPTTLKSDLLTHLEANPLPKLEETRLLGEAPKSLRWENINPVEGTPGSIMRLRTDNPTTDSRYYISETPNRETGRYRAVGPDPNELVGSWLDHEEGFTTPEEALARARQWLAETGSWGSSVQPEMLTTQPIVRPRYSLIDTHTGAEISQSDNIHHLQAAASGRENAYQNPKQTGWDEYVNKNIPGSNYQELLMTLPKKEAMSPHLFQTKEKAIFQQFWNGEIDGTQLNEQLAALKSQYDSLLKGNYGSPHWEQDNVLVHGRYRDTVDPLTGKPYLHVDEVQSDWHQTGREKGYMSDRADIEAQIAAANEQDRALAGKAQELWDQYQSQGITEADYTSQVEEIGKARQSIQDQQIRLKQNLGGLVPDAPFKDTWHQVMLKRLLRDAAERGHAGIQWNTGEVMKGIVGGELPGQAKYYGAGLQGDDLASALEDAIRGQGLNNRTPAQERFLNARSKADRLDSNRDVLDWADNIEASPEKQADYLDETGEQARLIRSDLLDMLKPGDEALVRKFLGLQDQVGPLAPEMVAANKYPADIALNNTLPNWLSKYIGSPVETLPGAAGAEGFRINFPQEFIDRVLHKGQPILNLAPIMAGGGGSALLAALFGEQNG